MEMERSVATHVAYETVVVVNAACISEVSARIKPPDANPTPMWTITRIARKDVIIIFPVKEKNK